MSILKNTTLGLVALCSGILCLNSAFGVSDSYCSKEASNHFSTDTKWIAQYDSSWGCNIPLSAFIEGGMVDPALKVKKLVAGDAACKMKVYNSDGTMLGWGIFMAHHAGLQHARFMKKLEKEDFVKEFYTDFKCKTW